MRDVLYKYFKDDRCKYYHPSDAIADEHYITYEWRGDKIVLSIGCNEGQVPVFVCKSSEELESKIKFIIS